MQNFAGVDGNAGRSRHNPNPSQRKSSRSGGSHHPFADTLNKPGKTPSQKTIIDLFSTTSPKPNSPDLSHLHHHNKRQKRDFSPPDSTPTTAFTPLHTPDMYTFPNGGSMLLHQALLEQQKRTQASGISTSGCHSGQIPRAKLVVKKLNEKPFDQNLYFKNAWVQLDAALDAVLEDKHPSISMEEVYNSVENACRYGYQEELYARLNAKCREYVTTHTRTQLSTARMGTEEAGVIRAVCGAWEAWMSRLSKMRCMFYYLDQSYLVHKEVAAICTLGLQLFREALTTEPLVLPRAIEGTCRLIDFDRGGTGGPHDKTLLKAIVKIFFELNLYEKHFAPCLVNHTCHFLQQWAHHVTQFGQHQVYVLGSENLIEQEMQRCNFLSFERNTRMTLSSMLDEILIREQLSYLVDNSNVARLIADNNKIRLKSLHGLLERIDSSSSLVPGFGSYTLNAGLEIINDRENESEMVPRLLELKQRVFTIWEESLDKDNRLGSSARDAFQKFMNQTAPERRHTFTENFKPSEMIAKYADRLLRGGWKATAQRHNGSDGDTVMTDENAEINQQLDGVIGLFRFVRTKGIFEAYYKNDLARRLLMGRSYSQDAEKLMVDKLRAECGSDFTHNLEQMFKDMETARAEMRAYNAQLPYKPRKAPVELNVNVLTAAAWPAYSSVSLTLPPEVERAQNDFEKFYTSRHEGKKLSWKHSLAYCHLKARFPNGNKDLAVSAFQAVVLIFFNDIPDGKSVSLSEIRDAVQLSENELKRTLASLSCGQYRLIRKHPEGPTITGNELFSYNSQFTSDKVRLKINQVQLNKGPRIEEGVVSRQRFTQDRQLETQAAIVRAMKRHQELSHSELVREVIKLTQNRGMLDVAEVKTNIESVIEKGFLERKENDRYLYKP